MQYVFTAVFTPVKDGSFFVNFPDLPGCQAQGKDLADTIVKAEALLCLCLFDMELHGIEVPSPSDHNVIKLNANEITSAILADTDPHHENYSNATASHSVEIPMWLAQVVEASGLDTSSIFTNALKQAIGMPIYATQNKPTPTSQNSANPNQKESPPAETPLLKNIILAAALLLFLVFAISAIFFSL